MKISKLLLLASIFLLHACTSSKPVYYSAGSTDYNGRTKITQPAFKYKINLVGVAVTLGSSAAGAFLGSKLDLVAKYNDKTQKAEPISAANTMIGGLAGFGVASLGNYLIGKQSATFNLKSQNELNEWVKKYNRHTMVLNGTYTSGSLILIDNRKDQNYLVKNWQDIVDFKIAFTERSSARDEVVGQGIRILDRKELPALLEAFPSTTQASALKNTYLEKSSTTSQAIEAGNRYPELKTQSEKRAFDLTISVDDAATFMEGFQNSGYKSQLDDKISNRIQSISDAQKFVRTFPTSKNLTSVEKRAVELAQSVSDAKVYKSIFSKPLYENELVEKLGNKLLRHYLPELISLYPNNIKIRKVKADYIRTSNSVFELFYAAKSYPDVLSFDELDRIAGGKINNSLSDADNYILLFKNGKYLNQASDLLLTSIYNDLRKLEREPNNLAELSRVIYKYESLANVPSEIHQLAEKLNNAEAPFRGNYERMILHETKKQYEYLLIISYTTQPDVRAFTIMDEMLKKSQVIDVRNPWVEYVYGAGAAGNRGIIFGRYCCPALLSGIDFEMFRQRVGPMFRENKYLSDFKINYYGSVIWDAVKIGWRDMWAGTGGSYEPESQSQISTPCYTVGRIKNETICKTEVELLPVNCANGNNFKMYYWTRSDEDKCNGLSAFKGNGYYRVDDLAHDAFLGKDKDQALKKGCDCK